MIRRSGIGRLLAMAILLMLMSGRADAALLRFHYALANQQGAMVLVPSRFGTAGERVTLVDTCPYDPAPVPTHTVTLKHTFTGQCVIVPLRLPEGTPNIQHRSNRIMYNYGSYSVEVHFLEDGTVNVQYSTGLLRGID